MTTQEFKTILQYPEHFTGATIVIAHEPDITLKVESATQYAKGRLDLKCKFNNGESFVEICIWEGAEYNHKKLQRKWNVEAIIARPQDITIMELGHTFMSEKEASHAYYMNHLTQKIEQAQREIEEIREANDTFRQKMATSKAKGEVL